MSEETVIKIEDVGVHPASGHILVRVKSITTRLVNGNTEIFSGPVRGYGVDAAGFQSRFGGKIENLIAWVKSEHIGYQGAHEKLVEELGKLRGKTI